MNKTGPVGAKTGVGLLLASVGAAITGLAAVGKLPPICIFQFAQFGTCGNPVITVNPPQPPPVWPTPQPLPAPPSSVPTPANSVITEDEYLKYVQAAKTALSTMAPTLSVQFPMSVYSPIGSRVQKTDSSSLEVIGYLDQESSKIQPVTPSELLGLLNQNAPSLYAQVSGTVSSGQKTLEALDVVVIDTKTQEVKTVDSVNAGDFIRDAVNSTLNGNLKPNNDYKLENYPLNR